MRKIAGLINPFDSMHLRRLIYVTIMCALYGKVPECCASMTECRVKLWRSKTGKSGASSVKLSSLPPTTSAFIENVHRCHFQVAIWKAALLESPPDMDTASFGWEYQITMKTIPLHC